MTDRTDAERFAWLYEHDAMGGFFADTGEVVVDVIKNGGPVETLRAWRRVRSKKQAHEAWRKCVDELMTKMEAGS